jgi:hypothetical protein
VNTNSNQIAVSTLTKANCALEESYYTAFFREFGIEPNCLPMEYRWLSYPPAHALISALNGYDIVEFPHSQKCVIRGVLSQLREKGLI